jgi:hypothetical protein
MDAANVASIVAKGPDEYAVIPDSTLEALRAWVENAHPLGHFCRAVVENDLREAVTRADNENLRALSAIVRLMYNRAPAKSWGYRQATYEWPLLLKECKESGRVPRIDYAR